MVFKIFAMGHNNVSTGGPVLDVWYYYQKDNDTQNGFLKSANLSGHSDYTWH